MSFITDFDAISAESKYVNILLWIIFGFGVLKLTTLTLRSLALLADLFILPAVNYSKYGAKRDNYCVVTGASDGIGKEYAIQMAERGFNLILISRTLSKLETMKEELVKKYSIEVVILAADISKDSDDNYKQIREVCENLPITVLINNVGQSHSIPVPFLETEENELRNIITINNTATLLITQIIAPLIVKTVRNSKQRGLILTMGSFGGLIPTPLLATYSGSKAFLQQWSTSLAGELKGDNVDVELVLSYLVTSSMSKIRKTSMLIPNPKRFVESTLKNVGRRCGAQERFATMTPYWSHALYHFIIEETVGVYSTIVNCINYSFHKSIRVRALKKAERLAKQQ
ncbi:ketoreductase NDAI_0C05330 [Naumovozyma dairenensis CBS 421]|uniref:Very-long-chain 3-oxoacyl-CoA reductase n=1 Tax=Naumovozyma dairenensis (strain ATCC 10597 / BCRC 20456 / CBS 421 / NBRC 0211 / NRRL Y-12639) TaxID=1071378 RepID=G0W8T1_NAUDC|nr:hypothetical protein NDAI_0C05330 [Naumovozyma dairenensis CBS 421]CCD24192.1 hypothetical protein NDAI_0C05330 [Naumovozyma dairenensis CBS 421]